MRKNKEMTKQVNNSNLGRSNNNVNNASNTVCVDVSDFFRFYYLYGDETLIMRCIDKVIQEEVIQDLNKTLYSELMDTLVKGIADLVENNNDVGVVFRESDHFNTMVDGCRIVVAMKNPKCH